MWNYGSRRNQGLSEETNEYLNKTEIKFHEFDEVDVLFAGP